MRLFLRSVAHSFRALAKNPGFTLSALAVLTLGIGANTAIFSVVNGVLLKPLPFPDSASIVTIFHVPPAIAFPGIKTFAVSAANYLDWRNQNDVFAAMTVFAGRALRLGTGSRVESVVVTISDAGFFDVAGTRPSAGRSFTAAECVAGRDGVIVLSDRFARSKFGSPERSVGNQMVLSGRNYQVIGVMPASFRVQSWFPASTQAWVPLVWTAEERTSRGNHNWNVAARLKSGVNVAKAQAAMNVISDRLSHDYPEEDKGWGAVVIGLRDRLVGEVRPALLMLLGAVGFVLLIACANSANLVLARTIARRKEFAIRAALGASQSQVLRPVLIETTILALAGGALGLLVARGGQSLVLKALADQMPRATEASLDGFVLAFTALASIATGIGSGLIAGMRLLRGDVNDSLKVGMGKSDAYSGGKTTQSMLVIAEVALSLILLVGAGLMVRTLLALRQTDPGFKSADVLTMTVPVPKAGGDKQRGHFHDEFLPRVAALPGVRSVAAIDNLPLQGGSQQPIAVEGRPAEVFALQRNVSVRKVTPAYFRTLGIPLLQGRGFDMADLSSDRSVVVISQSMASLFWPGEDPIGKRFRVSFTPEKVWEVVGVAGDIRDRGLDVLEPIAMLYTPFGLDGSGRMSLVVRGDSNVARLAPAIAGVLHQWNPDLPVTDVETLDDLVAQSLSQQRWSTWLFGALAGLAFLLAAVGIYSVLSFAIRSRVGEISVRMALGAGAGDVLRLVIVEGLKPTFLGIALGALGAVGLSGLLKKLIYGVTATDPLTFAIVAGLLIIVALAACAIPGYRATRVHPVQVLRGE